MGNGGSGITLAAFLHERRGEILARWKRDVRALASAADLTEPTLLDLVPELCAWLAQVVGHPGPDIDPSRIDMPELVDRHASQRAEESFALSEIIAELGLLRDSILREWEARGGEVLGVGESRALNRGIDHLITHSVQTVAQARERLMETLDRIATASLHASSLDELLRELIEVFLDASPWVDAVTILLREGELLRVRAVSGAGTEAHLGFTLPIGEGFSGTIARTRQPLSLTRASEDPLLRSPALKSLGILGLYGIPLIDEGELYGVAHIGSKSTSTFSRSDKLLLSAMAARATTGIAAHLLRQASERRAKEVEASERRFRATFENAAVGIAHVAPDGKWIRLNEKYCEILGYEHHELIELSFQDVTHPDDLGEDLAALERFLAGEAQTRQREKRYIRKDGGVVWVYLTNSSVRGDRGEILYFITVVQDISAQVRLRERLTFLSDASARLAESLDYEHTLRDVVALAVPEVADWCGVDIAGDDDSVAEPVAAMHRPSDQAESITEVHGRRPICPGASDLVAEVVRTGREVILTDVTTDGVGEAGADVERPAHWLEPAVSSLIVVPLTTAEQTTFGAMTMIRQHPRRFEDDDVTLARDLALRAAVAIENARLHQNVREAVRLREQFLAVVSHDLKSPLAAIELSAEALSRFSGAGQEPGARQQLQTIRRSARRMQRLIHDLLDLTSIQTGTFSVELVKTDLREILAEAAETHAPVAEARGVTFRQDIRLESATPIVGDRDRLQQVLANLVDNAISVCRAGDEVVLRARAQRDEALIAVSDTGPGIHDEKLEHIFELHWRHRKQRGTTGLGLYIAKRIAEAHDGRIHVESERGRGTTFWVTIPLAHAGPAPDG